MIMHLLNIVAHLIALFEAVAVLSPAHYKLSVITERVVIVVDFLIKCFWVQWGSKLDYDRCPAANLRLDICLNVQNRVPVLMSGSLLEGVHETRVVDDAKDVLLVAIEHIVNLLGQNPFPNEGNIFVVNLFL
jgi:hypothetical protein